LERYFSQSLARGLMVLRAFDRETPRLKVSGVAERTGLSRAAARRFLLTLRDLGYVSSDGEFFFLQPRVLDLGYNYLSSASVDTLIQPQLVSVAEQTSEASTFAVLDCDEVVIVARAFKRNWDAQISVGSRLPAHATALGQVLLASLPDETLVPLLKQANLAVTTESTISDQDALLRRLRQVRKRGYAIAQGQLIKQMKAVAVPVMDKNGSVVGAINVTSYAPDSQNSMLEKFLPVLSNAKSQIEAGLKGVDNFSNWVSAIAIAQTDVNS
jgi:IclR family transcriptional regulator, pca regulon regulatory protein